MNAVGTEWVTPGVTEDDVLGPQKNRLIDTRWFFLVPTTYVLVEI